MYPKVLKMHREINYDVVYIDRHRQQGPQQ
jgi:hypothetical protein